jgi:hypothetical protein
MKHEEITEKIIGVFCEVYNELGDGFLENERKAINKSRPRIPRMNTDEEKS